jgi:hypothetical protein
MVAPRIDPNAGEELITAIDQLIEEDYATNL